MTHSYVCLGSFVRVTRLIHMRDMTHSCVWHNFLNVTRMNESCHTYGWHMNDSYITSYSYMNDSFRCVTWLIRVCGARRGLVCTKVNATRHTHTDESRHTYEWVMSHTTRSRMSSCMHQRSCTYEWVMSRIWMSHVTRTNEPSHTYEWVMSHIWMSQVTHMNEVPCEQLYAPKDPLSELTITEAVFFTCDVLHLNAWHDSFTCERRELRCTKGSSISLANRRDRLHMCEASSIYVTWLIYTWETRVLVH